MEQPLIYTAKGNVPVELLELKTNWKVSNYEIVCEVQYYLDNILVRNDVYINKLAGEQLESTPGSFT